MLKYCIDENAEEPIMLIDTHIGFDEVEGMGINGAEFARELMFLDSLGKKTINVWICSEGGVVMDSMIIYNAILKTKAKVDTYGTGIVASSAVIVFQAGRKRVMMDWAKQMYHPASGGDSKKGLAAINDSISKMVSGRTGKTPEEILAVMAETTWLGAEECKAKGFCDEVEYSSDFNKPRLKAEQGIKANLKEALTYMNSLKPVSTKKISMKKITNRLKLNDEANEDSILVAINAIDSARETAEKVVGTLKTDIVNRDKEIGDLKNKIEKFETDQKAASDKAAADLVEANEKEADALLTEGVKAGKIENKADVLKKWKDQFTANHAATKSLFELIPTPKKAGPDFKNKIDNKDENGDIVVPYSIAGQMARISNKSNANAK